VRTILANRTVSQTTPDDRALPIYFAGHRYVISSDRRQILNLLLSTYETAVKTNVELIKAHEDLKRAQAQLIEAEKLQSVGRLAAGVAHEVRNPLAIMEMGMTFLADQPIAEDGQMILNEMKEAVKRTNVVISSLMDLSTPRGAGIGEANLNEVIEGALRAVEESLGGITVVRELAADLPPCRIDSSRIEQVFINVFTNAIQAMPEGGTLTVGSSAKVLTSNEVNFDAGDRSGARLREGERAAVVEVRDTGSGIEPENLGRVFEPFFSTKPTGQGMGLGLTVARKIIDSHRGRIELRNAAGGGTVVTMALRLA
jgi:signal transduction histidine kinase